VDTRDPERPPNADVECQRCAARIPLDPRGMHLTMTHAALQCPECGAWLQVRRSDAYRDVDTTVAWLFATYADEAPQDKPDHGERPGTVMRMLARMTGGRSRG
jgi:hypothetical protein